MPDLIVVDRGGDRSLADRGNIALRATFGSGALPAGGTVSQILEKASSTDYDAHWVDNLVFPIIAADTARVDPSGDDSTGIIGNIGKPFATVQGAITALEGVTPINYPLIILPHNYVAGDDITTSLVSLMFQGPSENESVENLIFTEPTNQVTVIFNNCTSGNISATSTGGLFLKYDLSGEILGTITSSNGDLTIVCSGGGLVSGTLSAPGSQIILQGVNWAREDQTVVIDSAGSAIHATQCVIADILHAASIVLKDSRLKQNTSGVVPTYQDLLLANPIFPNSDPHVAGAGYWAGTVFTKSLG